MPDLRPRPEPQADESRPPPGGWGYPGVRTARPLRRARLDARCEIVGLGPCEPETVERLMCDSPISRIVTGPHSRILDFGRRARYFNAAQRLAIFVRDGGRCAFPDCTRQRFLEVHHLNPWENGGRTDLANGAALCHEHHIRVHEQHWSLVRHADGRYSARPPRQRTRAAA